MVDVPPFDDANNPLPISYHKGTSPSSAGPGPASSGRRAVSSSSIGKLITSVGPGSSIHLTCSSVIASTSTSRIDSSASGLIRIRSSTYRATDTSSISSMPKPDSLATSMVIDRTPAGGRRRGRSDRRTAGRRCCRCRPDGPASARRLGRRPTARRRRRCARPAGAGPRRTRSAGRRRRRRRRPGSPGPPAARSVARRAGRPA